MKKPVTYKHTKAVDVLNCVRCVFVMHSDEHSTILTDGRS